MKPIEEVINKLLKIKPILVVSVIGFMIIVASNLLDSLNSIYSKIFKKTDTIVLSNIKYKELDGYSVVKKDHDVYTGGINVNFTSERLVESCSILMKPSELVVTVFNMNQIGTK